MKYAIIIFFLLFVSEVEGAHWCKVIYKKGTQQGELKQQLNRCKNLIIFYCNSFRISKRWSFIKFNDC